MGHVSVCQVLWVDVRVGWSVTSLHIFGWNRRVARHGLTRSRLLYSQCLATHRRPAPSQTLSRKELAPCQILAIKEPQHQQLLYSSCSSSSYYIAVAVAVTIQQQQLLYSCSSSSYYIVVAVAVTICICACVCILCMSICLCIETDKKRGSGLTGQGTVLAQFIGHGLLEHAPLYNFY